MKWTDAVISFVIQYGLQIIGAVIILGGGLVMAWWVGKLASAALSGRVTHVPMRSLIVRVVRLSVIGFALVLALDKFGVQTASLIAGISVVGVGVSLAAQGVLGNGVAGLTIIFSKPFLVEEYVEVAGVDGLVEKIELFSTTLVRPDQSRVLIPNRKIVGEIVHNYGARRQLSLSVGVAYGSDLNVVMQTIRRVLEGNARVLREPTPGVGVSALADSSVTVAFCGWVKVTDYGAARAELYKAVIEAFEQAGIEIPFPRTEVRLVGQAALPGAEARANN